MIMNSKPYPISFEREMSQALVCRYGEEMRQYVFKPDIDVSGLSCLLQIAKTDGTFTENGIEVHTDPDTGECTLVITIPQQATVVKGLNRYSICCYGEVETETHLLYSAEGPLWVDDNLITDDMIQSVAEVNGVVFPQDFLTVDNLVDIVNYVAAEILKDDTTSETTTWSSQKINSELSNISNIIDDDNISSNSTWSSQKINSELLSIGHIYSTLEMSVGSWIDGKTVYEKTIVNELALTGSWQTYFPTSEIDTIISVDARCTRDGEEASIAFSNYEVISWLNRNNYIQVATPTNSSDWVIHSMTVRYTKV